MCNAARCTRCVAGFGWGAFDPAQRRVEEFFSG
jgi:hypothetical protein